MSEPVVSYPLRVVLDRIEADVREIRDDVAMLKTGSAVETAREAVGSARRALWIAGASPLVAAGMAWWLSRR